MTPLHLPVHLLLHLSAVGALALSQSPQSELSLRIASHIEVLASDAFGGRGPGTEGEQLTLDYLKSSFESLGLEPAGEGDSWFQTVPMLELTPQAAPVASTTIGGTEEELVMARDAMLWSPLIVATSPDGTIGVEDSQLVFVGHGIVAPEQGWNDYEGIDVSGKTVVALVNDPGFRSNDPSLFRGRAMTYYGRWTYKFEEAERQGAAACLLIHEDDAAGYGWTVVAQSWGQSQLQLAADRKESPTKIRGWLQRSVAERLFAKAGADLNQLIDAASKRGAKPAALEDATFSASLANRMGRLASANVVAKVVGSKRPDEAVLVLAHWDHLGTRKGGPDEDNIFNGAVDNASGTAALLELAGLIATQDPAPERSVVFVVTTAEEKGLLGSKHYAANPVVPLAKTVCGLNIDVANTLGPMSDIIVVGYGASELDDDLRAVASAQARVVVAEPTPEKGFYFRSDHFSLAKVGVPMMYTSGGTTSREHGAPWVTAQKEAFTKKRYHRVADEFDESWNLEGAAEDVRLFHGLVRLWASDQRMRQWAPDSEFKAARDKMLRQAPAPK